MPPVPATVCGVPAICACNVARLDCAVARSPDRTGPGQRAEVARLEIGPLGVRIRQPLLQLRQLRIEEVEALRRLAAIAAQVGFDEDVDQLLGDLLRQLGAGRGGGDLEQIVLLAFHLDRLREARDAIGDVAVARHGLRKVGAAHHLFQVHRADQCLADRVDVLLLRLGGGIHRRRQDRLHLHEHARPRFVAARDLAHHEPAEHAHAPGDRQRQPAPGPDRMEREARFVVQAVHPADVGTRIAALQQIGDVQLIFVLFARIAVVPDQLRLVARRILAEAADRDHRIEQRHVGAIGNRRGLFGRADHAHLLAVCAGEILDDHRHARVGDILAQRLLDVGSELRGRLADRGHVVDQRRGDAAIGAHLHLRGQFRLAPDEDVELVERADDIFLARLFLRCDIAGGRQFGMAGAATDASAKRAGRGADGEQDTDGLTGTHAMSPDAHGPPRTREIKGLSDGYGAREVKIALVTLQGRPPSSLSQQNDGAGMMAG
ncbi:hypothetical protein WR25_10391 [Diploscapter pachys]|uniref:Uncharacterized protein n=1 Tax=Diploscapter pachys TaxID=2018661 RepID=A0A2A2M306_9BILA|nr:hypothetical protein WR25_10391 [Diploscapter pachys]